MHNNSLEKGTILRGCSYSYEIVKTLGQGTFGITYLAKVRMEGSLGSIQSNMFVAIKEFFMRAFNGRSGATVTTGSTSDLYDYYKSKFAREATNLSKMKHPNIVKVLELFRQNDTIYYSMEYIDGGSLNDYIGNKLRLSESEAVQAILQIGKAISFMHSKGMLHLDLKPQNIMRRSDGNYILIDFGLSKQYDENGNPESKTEVGKGTQGYAPIEQAYYHDNNDFPVTMDVYALGGTLFKMLTGVKPPEASIILNDGFPYEEIERYGISTDLKNCVAHAMAPRKKDRYQTVDIFIKDICNKTILTKQANKFNDVKSSLTDMRPVFLQNGKYKVIRTVYSNNFYNIYEAISMISNRRVVIKEFSFNITEPDSTISSLRNRFINSAKTMLRMHHPGIEKGIDIFEEKGTAYYVMEYIEGRTLNKIIHESPIHENKALKYICQIAESLLYIHKHNILYLDVKPSNIIIDSSDNAILIDFTSLRQYDDDGFLEEDYCDWNVHTPGYSPLEQIKRNGILTFTPATDIYALGATFYKLLTGYTPQNAVYLATGEEQLEPIPSYVSESTRMAISSAMDPNINKRPQTIEQFLEILNNDERKNSEQTQIDVIPQTKNEGKANWETGRLKKQANNKQFEKKGNPSYLVYNVCGVDFKMIKIHKGGFKMGTLGLYQQAMEENVFPRVMLSDFYLGETTVTQDLWEAIMGNNPSGFIGGKNPVEYISWYDCMDFIKALSLKTGIEFRLPTEAEWEYAARGGGPCENLKYSGSNDINTVCWYDKNSEGKPHPVKFKKPNRLGLYDMSGNVMEWCSDWCDAYKNKKVENPQGPHTGKEKICRGGSYYRGDYFCRVYDRFKSFTPDTKSCDLGFRLALSIP